MPLGACPRAVARSCILGIRGMRRAHRFGSSSLDDPIRSPPRAPDTPRATGTSLRARKESARSTPTSDGLPRLAGTAGTLGRPSPRSTPSLFRLCTWSALFQGPFWVKKNRGSDNRPEDICTVFLLCLRFRTGGLYQKVKTCPLNIRTQFQIIDSAPPKSATRICIFKLRHLAPFQRAFRPTS